MIVKLNLSLYDVIDDSLLKDMTEFGSGGAGAQGLPARCAGILGIPCSKVVSLCSTNGKGKGNQSVSY